MHSIPIKPWEAAGNISSRVNSYAFVKLRFKRFKAALAIISASKAPSFNFFTLVAIFPLTGIVFRSGLKFNICDFLRGLEVPITEFIGNVSKDQPSLDNKISEADSR